jgi:hypothetical protein
MVGEIYSDYNSGKEESVAYYTKKQYHNIMKRRHNHPLWQTVTLKSKTLTVIPVQHFTAGNRAIQ